MGMAHFYWEIALSHVLNPIFCGSRVEANKRRHAARQIQIWKIVLNKATIVAGGNRSGEKGKTDSKRIYPLIP